MIKFDLYNNNKENKIMRNSILAICFLIFSISNCIYANNENEFYAGKTITLIVPFGKGGDCDIVANAIRDNLAYELNATINIEYITGLGGSHGLVNLKNTAANGLTIGIGATSNLITYPLLNSDVSYDVMQDFSYVASIVYVPHIIVAHKKVAGKNFTDFVTNIKVKSYDYLSPGAGSSPYFIMQGIANSTKAKLNHIPVKNGMASALKSMNLGRSEIMAGLSLTALPFILEHKLDEVYAVAVTSPTRIKEIPNTPTLTELGFADLNQMSIFGIIAPKQVDGKVLQELERAIVKVLKLPEVRAKLGKYGVEIAQSSGAQFQAEVQEHLNIHKQAIDKYGINN